LADEGRPVPAGPAVGLVAEVAVGVVAEVPLEVTVEVGVAVAAVQPLTAMPTVSKKTTAGRARAVRCLMAATG
jgi:hypothetical protein